MRLQITTSKNAKCFYVVKSVYYNGKHSNRVVEKLGNLQEVTEKAKGQDPVAWAKAYVERLNREEEEKQEQEVTVRFSPQTRISAESQRRYSGGYLFLKRLYHALGLKDVCKTIRKRHEFEYNLDEILQILLYTRIIYPGSKLSSHELASRFFDAPKCSLHQVYRALDVLDQESDYIQAKLYENSSNYHKRDTSILYYDCTNYFFEVEEEDNLRKYGKSKEHRPNPIVQMGLFLDADGIPLAYHIDSGSTNEQKTLKPLEKKIIQDFGEDHFIVCTDAGLASTDNRAFNSISGRGFVVTQSLKQLPAPIQEWALEPTGWQLQDEAGMFDLRELDEEKHAKAVFFKEQWIDLRGIRQRMVVTYSIASRNYQRKIRERQISQAQKTLDRSKEKLPPRSQNDYRRFIQQSFFTQEGEVSDICRLNLDIDIAQKEAMFDGFYAVCTNLQGPTRQILAINHQRWEIEESFRIMKTEFKGRPVFLSKEQRIRAHFLTCFMALVLYRLLEKIDLQNRFTCEDIIDHLRDCEFCHLDGQGFIPVFTPDALFNALQDSSGFRLDSQLISYKSLNSIKKSFH